MASFAARSVLRSAANSARSSAARISVGVKPRASASLFRVSSQSPLSSVRSQAFNSPTFFTRRSASSPLMYGEILNRLSTEFSSRKISRCPKPPPEFSPGKIIQGPLLMAIQIE